MNSKKRVPKKFSAEQKSKITKEGRKRVNELKKLSKGLKSEEWKKQMKFFFEGMEFGMRKALEVMDFKEGSVKK